MRKPLLPIANKLLGRQNLNFNQLTTPEPELWKLFENNDIYKFLTGEKDTVREFRHNYIIFSAKLKVNIELQGLCQNLVPYQQALPKIQQAIQQAHSAPSPSTHNLHECKQKINYRALHLGHEIQQATQEIKQNCKTMQKSLRKFAKNAITKFAPGAFSPKQPSPATTPLSPHTSSSSSWKFWPSK